LMIIGSVVSEPFFVTIIRMFEMVEH